MIRQKKGTIRFGDFREVTAKYDTPATKTDCGHAALKGQTIGYAGRGKGQAAHIQCSACWTAWVCENAEAEADELSP